MNAKTLTMTLSFLAFAFGSLAATGCAVDAGESKPDSTQSSSEADTPTTGGGGADPYGFCNDEGYCQCFGADQCGAMFALGLCKSLTFCEEPSKTNPTPVRCSCLNFLTAPPRPRGGTVITNPVVNESAN